MEKIKNISITNFKSIKKAELNDCRKVNLLIGYPNVGKSNILEALSLSYLQHVFFGAANELNLSFDEIIRLKNFSHFFNIYSKENKCNIKINDSNLDIELLNKFLFKFDNKDILGSKETDFLTIEGLTSNSSNPLIKKYVYKENIKFVNSVDSILHVPNGQNLPKVLESYDELRADIESLFIDFNLKLVIESFPAEIKLLNDKRKDKIILFDYKLMADSIQRLIFHKAAIASNFETVILFEEPEAHTFPPYIKKLTHEIIKNENNNQYFITTHSTDILSEFIENDKMRSELSVFIVDYKNEGTNVTRIKDEDIIRVGQAGIDLLYNIENFI